MSQLDTDVQAVTDSEAALEARVTAHEQHDVQVAADLQAQIDALKAGGDTSAAIAGLEALKARMDAFDPAAPTP